jgi:hypothetical protein
VEHTGVFDWLVEVIESDRPLKVRIAVAADTRCSGALRAPGLLRALPWKRLSPDNHDPIDTTASIPTIRLRIPALSVPTPIDVLRARSRSERCAPASRPASLAVALRGALDLVSLPGTACVVPSMPPGSHHGSPPGRAGPSIRTFDRYQLRSRRLAGLESVDVSHDLQQRLYSVSMTSSVASMPASR